MNNNNFTAQEIKSLQKTSEGVFREIVEAIKAVKDACSSMSGVVASGDSNLSGKWSSISDSIAGPITTADNSFHYLSDLLNAYAEKTVSNEESAESDLGSIDSAISALGSQASKLVDLMNAAGDGGSAGQPTVKPSDNQSNTPNTVPAGGMNNPNTPPIIYAPPTPNVTPIGLNPTSTGPLPGIRTGDAPTVIYAPPSPGTVVGLNPTSTGPTTSLPGVRTADTPTIIYAPPTPSSIVGK